MTLVPSSSHGGTVDAAGIEATFTAAGQIYQGTGAGTGGLVLPPGYVFGYDQITAPVTQSSTTEATPTALIACAAHVFDGGAVMLEVFFPDANPQGTPGFCRVVVFEGATEIGRLGQIQNDAGANVQGPFIGKIRFTPTAASHTYTIGAYGSAATTIFTAGVGGTGAYGPGYAQFTKC